MTKIHKILVANRSEIAIRVFRAASELNISTVAIYSYEDRFALHRLKADESYQIGNPGEPLKNYLDIEAIIACAKQCKADAIHPGYGFLSENAHFAERCREENILFLGPQTEVLKKLGDKVSAKKVAIEANIPILGGDNSQTITSLEQALESAKNIGYPVMLKAVHGGGGRGMRMIDSEDTLQQVFASAQNESKNAFGSDEVFIEKYIANAKHIEVQLLGDQHGNLVHLYERDCSLQRRHQKVIEIAPSPGLSEDLREKICQAALSIGKNVAYQSAGTVEFLLDCETDQFYFIEVNPRIQVEHTVTEEVTGVDIVKSQILIAQGLHLNDPDIGINQQSDVSHRGFAIQCRVTTENPKNNFLPDYGRLHHYRSAAGAGIRLDAGSAFTGAVISPYFDSMLVKVTAKGRTFKEASTRMTRALNEFRVRGVKTNLLFLENLIQTSAFQNSTANTRFIDNSPELFQFDEWQNRGSKLLTYLGSITVNGNADISSSLLQSHGQIHEPNLPDMSAPALQFTGHRERFKQLGKKDFCQWILDQKELLITDTTMRDAHQSLFATRMRGRDMFRIADYYRQYTPQFFSLEMWGGATFDTSMRFLNECPWERLQTLRAMLPNTLTQMLLRASSAVGYANYPDNLVKKFIHTAANNGIDIFRIFDALNWKENLAFATEIAAETDALSEVAICYSGDITNPARQKYNLNYYVNLAKEIKAMGADIIAIKDMAGLCKPDAARALVTEIKMATDLPVHFHTHDTSGMAAASILAASDAGVDIVDMALAAMSGNTSQPNMNTILESLRFSERASSLPSKHLDQLSDYWRQVRECYWAFETTNLPTTADLYEHEIPGGQYTNLYAQAKALGLSDRWYHICQMYAEVNRLFGDIIKVTPSSKAVGDMALFMIANQLTIDDVLNSDKQLSYPESVLDLLSGKMGQPLDGFPQDVCKKILNNTPVITERAGKILEPTDFDAIDQTLQSLNISINDENRLSYALYPKVFEKFHQNTKQYSDLSIIPTPSYFYGLSIGEEIKVSLAPGKDIIIKLIAIGEKNHNNQRHVFFELNGLPREVIVNDGAEAVEKRAKVDPSNPKQIGTNIPGMVSGLFVKSGDRIKKGEKLLSIEAMKMETNLYAERDGVIADVLIQQGQLVEAEDLLMCME